MDYSHLVADFAARKGITKVPMGKRAYSETLMARAEGFQPTTLPVWKVTLQGEDGMVWTDSYPAEDERAAEFDAKRKYPESMVLEISR